MNKKMQISNNANSAIKNAQDITNLVEKKLLFFQDVIQKTILHAQKNKMLDILGVSDLSACINTLNSISEKMKTISDGISQLPTDNIVSNLQVLNNELSSLLKNYGTESFEDLLTICFGNNNAIVTNDDELLKYDLLKKYFHPTQYKVVNLKKTEKEMDGKIKTSFVDDFVTENTKNFDCTDVSLNSKHFHMKVYGLKVYIYHSAFNKHLLIYGIVDDIVLQFLNNKYINNAMSTIKNNLPNNEEFKGESFERFFTALTLKDYLIMKNTDVYNKFIGCQTQYKLLKQKTLLFIVKDFIGSDLYTKRNTLIHLLVASNEYDNKYLAYLLYDLLSNDANGAIDTVEQTILFDSFPWSIKQNFREAMKKTIQYTNDLSNFDMNKIPLEQQICLMKTSDAVKEKAMIKLKEIKAKSEDSGSKARQYLDGLLKIPFNVYTKEPVMCIMDQNRNHMAEMVKNPKITELVPEIQKKDKYTSIEILSNVKKVKSKVFGNNMSSMIKKIKKHVSAMDKHQLVSLITTINSIIEKEKLNTSILYYQGKNKKELTQGVAQFVDFCSITNPEILLDKQLKFDISIDFLNEIKEITSNFGKIGDYMKNVKTILDDAVHGHDKAKKQIERIIGQWINGEQDGYCFGFEGPAGVGKTSLAKRGLANCLIDEKGNSRPFSMIQMGGDSNGSTLHGHNYTYVGSTWGGIVQILIDKKCMNPIIFIDELDKISKTEHGKEIVGILTHLLDPTQNDVFQDKYFSGIDLDLSKALFVLSYNDVDSIDKILLDRIHRIKFSNLSLEDKLIIAKNHMLPEVYKKMGLEDIIIMDDDVLKFIIDEYTSEPGVRKMREIIFEIVGEINIDILKNCRCDYPIKITIEDIKTKYFKDKRCVVQNKIHDTSVVGIINGLWANSQGGGGFLPIQAKFYPSDTFLSLKLTGLQGDVMKESMNVALTVAWNLTSFENKEKIRELYEEKKNGIHIHVPSGSVPKDGPSAGSAIIAVIFSLLNNRKIKNHIAITGENSLDGKCTEIGGLDLKILGGIKGGVTEFIYPVENEKDFKTFMEKYKDTDLVKDIKFHKVNNIHEVFELIFEDE
jgi:ATP-dependent Lon protease